MKAKNLIFSLAAGVLTAASLAGVMPKFVPEMDQCIEVSAANSGKCGKNVTWEMDKNGTVTISGKGKMDDYNYLISTPFGNSDTNGSIQRSRVRNVVIKNGVTSIGNAVFYGCINIDSITIPSSVTSIGKYSFNKCRTLKKITIPKGVKTIGSNAFLDCTALTSVSLPDSITSVDDHAFQSCENLTSINIPNNMQKISDSTFIWCKKLESITIPSSVKTIGEDAFGECVKLKKITVPKSVTSIGTAAFYGCSALSEITIMNPKCNINGESGTICSSYSSKGSFKGTICGYDNSTAQAYAKKYGYTFKSMGQDPDSIPLKAVPATGVKGDANGDSKLNVRDAANIAKYLSRGKVSLLPKNADFNGDGKVNVRDAASIAKQLASGGK